VEATSILDKGEHSASRSGRLTLDKRAVGTHLMEGYAVWTW